MARPFFASSRGLATASRQGAITVAADKLQYLENTVAAPFPKFRTNPRRPNSNEKAKSGEEGASPFRYTHNRRSKENKEAHKLSNKMVKYVPTGGIVLSVIAGIIAIIAFVSPATQINHIVEMVNQKYSIGDMITSRRERLIWSKKLSGDSTQTVSGLEARYRNISPDIVDKFKANGFSLLDADGNIINASDGTKIAASIVDTFDDGRTYSTNNITSALENNAELRTRVGRVYKSSWANWYDKTSTKIKQRFGLVKNNSGIAKPDGDVDDMDEAVKEQMAKQTADETNARVSSDEIEVKDGDPDAEMIEQQNRATQQRENELRDALGEFNGANAKVIATKILKGLSVLSVLQGACDVLSFINFVNGVGKKDLVARQQMGAFMQFGALSGQIQAGDADPDIVSAVGNRINAESTYELEDGSFSKPNTGTMGPAYQYVSGERAITEIDGGTIMHTTGGLASFGLIGRLISDLAYYTAGSCAVITNPAVRISTTIAGIALSLYTFGGSAVAKAGIEGFMKSQLFSYTSSLVTQMAVKILSGQVVGTDLVGDAFLSAVIIGGGALLTKAAGASGMPVLGPIGMTALYGEQQKYLAQLAEEDRLQRSPFDATSQNTFLGGIMAKLIPRVGMLSSISGLFTTIGSLVSGAMSSIIPTSSAVSLSRFELSSGACKDNEYNDAGVATDPFCNLIYGVPVEYLDMDPEEVLRELERFGEISIAEDGKPTILTHYFGNTENRETEIKKYEIQCVNRSVPITIFDEREGDGSNCIARDGEDNYKKALYALFFIDSRIEDNLNGDGMKVTNNSAGTSSGIPAEAGCKDAKDCAEKISKLYDEGIISAQSTSTWPEYMKKIAVDGKPQPSACSGQSSINSEEMVINTELASTLIRLSHKYKFTISNFGFAGDAGRNCDGNYHPKGQAVDITSISNGANSTGGINYIEDSQSKLVAQFMRDFVEATHSENSNTMVHVGQTQCSVAMTDAAKLPNIYKVMGDSCDHLHLAVTP
jgi:hypothetical protein